MVEAEIEQEIFQEIHKLRLLNKILIKICKDLVLDDIWDMQLRKKARTELVDIYRTLHALSPN